MRHQTRPNLQPLLRMRNALLLLQHFIRPPAPPAQSATASTTADSGTVSQTLRPARKVQDSPSAGSAA